MRNLALAVPSWLTFVPVLRAINALSGWLLYILGEPVWLPPELERRATQVGPAAPADRTTARIGD
jgi:hypothetical protein